MKKFLIRILVISIIFLSFLYLFNQFSGNRAAPNKSVQPNKILALEELFGSTVTGGKVKPSQNKLASIWFDQTFQDGNDSTYVVFVKEQSLDENGKLINCHSCETTIDAVTYKIVSGTWTVVSKQKNIAEIGSWGDAPNVSSAEVLQLSPENTALLIKMKWSGQGNTEGGDEILAYHQNNWRYLGFLNVSGDNEGTGCADSRKNEPVNESGLFCWSYTGQVTKQQSNETLYPNIIVNYTGTNYDERTGEIISLGETTFSFNGKEYINTKKLDKKNDVNTENKQVLNNQNVSNIDLITSNEPTSEEKCPISKIKVERTRVENQGDIVTAVFGVVINGCSIPTGPRISIIFYDQAGNLLSVEELWPAGSDNIPAKSDYPFEIRLNRVEGFTKFEVRVISTHTW